MQNPKTDGEILNGNWGIALRPTLASLAAVPNDVLPSTFTARPFAPVAMTDRSSDRGANTSIHVHALWAETKLKRGYIAREAVTTCLTLTGPCEVMMRSMASHVRCCDACDHIMLSRHAAHALLDVRTMAGLNGPTHDDTSHVVPIFRQVKCIIIIGIVAWGTGRNETLRRAMLFMCAA